MDRDRYFVERCKNLPRKQRQTILLLEYRVQISALYSKTKVILLEYRVQISVLYSKTKITLTRVIE